MNHDLRAKGQIEHEREHEQLTATGDAMRAHLATRHGWTDWMIRNGRGQHLDEMLRWHLDCHYGARP